MKKQKVASKAKAKAPKKAAAKAAKSSKPECVIMFAFEDFEQPEVGNVELSKIHRVLKALVDHSLAKKLPLQITVEPTLKLLDEAPEGMEQPQAKAKSKKRAK